MLRRYIIYTRVIALKQLDSSILCFLVSPVTRDSIQTLPIHRVSWDKLGFLQLNNDTDLWLNAISLKSPQHEFVFVFTFESWPAVPCTPTSKKMMKAGNFRINLRLGEADIKNTSRQPTPGLQNLLQFWKCWEADAAMRSQKFVRIWRQTANLFSQVWGKNCSQPINNRCNPLEALFLKTVIILFQYIFRFWYDN
jgi:hypothetical protein